MAMKRLTAIDSQTLNGAEGIKVEMERSTSATAYTVSLTSRARSHLTPQVADVQFNTRKRTLRMWYEPGSHGLDQEEMNHLLHRVFMPWEGARTLHATDGSDDYEAEIRITSFGRTSPVEWFAEVEFIDGVWKKSLAETPVSSSPIMVGGNVFAQPTITITDGEALTRDRFTFTDKTGHGVAGLLVGVTPGDGGLAETNYRVYANGIELPFKKEGSNLYFRLAIRARESAFVDVFYGAAIDNQTTAGALDTGGITLDAALIASRQYTTDPKDPFGKPLASSLSWHPGVVTRHPSSRDYTFGFDGDNRIRLIDRTATGEQYNLPDDADAYILTSPVEIASISDLTFNVTAGYRRGQRSGSSEDGTRVQRVMIRAADGGAQADGPQWPEGREFHGDLPSGGLPESYPNASNDYMFYVQFTFGDMSFPHTYSWSEPVPDTEEGGAFFGTHWENDRLPWEFADIVTEYLPGVTVTTGEPGFYYVRFPEALFPDADLPLFSMSIHPKDGQWERSTVGPTPGVPHNDGGTMYAFGPDSTDALMLFEAVWVDPDTLEPFDDQTGASAPVTEDPLVGVVTVEVVYRTRDSEDWITAWSERVVGSEEGTSESFSPTVSISNAVQVAVVIKPAASLPNMLNWGTLEMTGNPVVTLDSSRFPTLVSVTGLDAQRLDGTLQHDDTGAKIILEEVVGADGGLVIDTENLTIQATSGPFYGKIRNTGGVRLFDLRVGENNWSLLGDLASASATFTWHEREAS